MVFFQCLKGSDRKMRTLRFQLFVLSPEITATERQPSMKSKYTCQKRKLQFIPCLLPVLVADSLFSPGRRIPEVTLVFWHPGICVGRKMRKFYEEFSLQSYVSSVFLMIVCFYF